MRRPLAEDAARALVQVGDARPAEVAAARAVRFVVEVGTSLATAEALDVTRLHTGCFGVGPRPVYLGDPSFQGCAKAVPSLVLSRGARPGRREQILPAVELDPRAAAALMRPSQWMTDGGTRSPDTGKLSTALAVSPPQS